MLTLALTDPGRGQEEFARYADWVKRGIPGAEIRRLSSATSPTPDLESCNGLILTGGGDVHPRFYDMPEVLGLTNSVDESRDEFEFRVIEDALRLSLPVLGICRGSQVFNVARGGTLVPDIERTGHPSHRKVDGADRTHGVLVEESSQLRVVVGSDSGTINSSHHQAADRPGSGLVVSARSDDGIAEALEWERPDGRPFLLLVQWHPERMRDQESPFSRAILERLRREAERTLAAV